MTTGISTKLGMAVRDAVSAEQGIDGAAPKNRVRPLLTAPESGAQQKQPSGLKPAFNEKAIKETLANHATPTPKLNDRQGTTPDGPGPQQIKEQAGHKHNDVQTALKAVTALKNETEQSKAAPASGAGPAPAGGGVINALTKDAAVGSIVGAAADMVLPGAGTLIGAITGAGSFATATRATNTLSQPLSSGKGGGKKSVEARHNYAGDGMQPEGRAAGNGDIGPRAAIAGQSLQGVEGIKINGKNLDELQSDLINMRDDATLARGMCLRREEKGIPATAENNFRALETSPLAHDFSKPVLNGMAV